MGWFHEQIKERIARDNDNFTDALNEIGNVITGKKTEQRKKNLEQAKRSEFEFVMGKILDYYHEKPRKVPEEVFGHSDQLEYICRASGLMHRKVVLDAGWYKDAAGAFLGTKTDGTAVALLPNRISGYSVYNPRTGKQEKITAETAGQLEQEAICFYRSFPQKKLSIASLLRYTMESVPESLYMLVFVLTGLATLIGMLSPAITHSIFDKVVPSGNMRVLWAITIFSLCTTIGIQLMSRVRSLVDGRISTQMNMAVQAATMERVLSLPPDFFHAYSTGELTTRIQYLNSLCSAMYQSFLSVLLTSVFSLIYLAQVFLYAPALVVPSLCVTAILLVHALLNTVLRMKTSYAAMKASGKKNGMTYAMFTGIQKIKLSGAEKRAFTRWTKAYTEEIRNTYGIPVILQLGEPIGMLIGLAGNLILYAFAVSSETSVADYYAFTAAYGMVSGAVTALVGVGLKAAEIRPILELVRPILETVPETSVDKLQVTKLTGSIELNHVSFRYGDSTPWVLDDLSVKIYPGQYIGVVGATGSGKSTLMRVLLGMLTPQKGSVFYDSKNLERMDIKSLRKQIGVVMQRDKLFHGDIYSNIIISAPEMTVEDAWKAAELADIADEIRAMPMGMFTVVSDGCGVSGGQKQRLMIARAVAGKPKILMFDEATSALDNISQKKVSDALDKLRCTRVIIAHRLSTIRNCDRILVLEQGKIVEDGTYEELLARNGTFANLIARQRVEEE